MENVKYTIVSLYSNNQALTTAFQKIGVIKEVSDPDNSTANEILQKLNKKNSKDKEILIKALDQLKSNHSKEQLNKIITDFFETPLIDIVIGSPPYTHQESDKNELYYDFLVEIDNQKQSQFTLNLHPHLHFFRIVLLLKPKFFILENPSTYFSTMEGEFLPELFRTFGYTTNPFIFEQNHRGLLLGNTLNLNLKLPFAPSKSKNNQQITFSDYMMGEFYELLADQCKSMLDTIN